LPEWRAGRRRLRLLSACGARQKIALAVLHSRDTAAEVIILRGTLPHATRHAHAGSDSPRK
jgi:hypothetical protein